MKNDPTITLLNFVLAVLVVFGVLFAVWSMGRTRDLRQLQAVLQVEIPRVQAKTQIAGALLNDTISYNATVRNPELAQIIQSAKTPQTAAK